MSARRPQLKLVVDDASTADSGQFAVPQLTLPVDWRAQPIATRRLLFRFVIPQPMVETEQ
ncbi:MULTISPECIES: hypothetical protein [Sphingomonas]|uniref:hypothetical protein n=1 Tax=Sphingomonas TaxID=13687 RepID=UPI0008356EAE|nr:hypothetical protein [Sphingomonas sp. CCH10-B3]